MKKMRIKKVSVVFALLVAVVVTMLGVFPSEKVYAAKFYTMHRDVINEYGSDEDSSNPRIEEYQDYRFTAGDSSKMYLMYYSRDDVRVDGTPYKDTIAYWVFVTDDSSDNSVLATINYSTGETLNVSLSGLGSFKVGEKTYYTSYGQWSGGWQEFTSSADATLLVDCPAIQSKYDLKTSNAVFLQALKSYLGGEDDDLIKESDSNDTSLGSDPDAAVKSDDLGTLVGMENLYRSYVEMGNSDSSAIVNERTHHFGWKKKTSTDLNLLDNDYDSIDVYCYLKVFDVKRVNWITKNSEPIDDKRFDKLFLLGSSDASKLSMEIKQTHIWNDILTKDVKDIIDSTGLDTALYNVTYDYDFYFKLIGKKNGKYYKGGLVRLHSDGTKEEITGGDYTVTTNTADEDDNGNVTDNSDSESGTGYTGNGDNYEDAKQNADSAVSGKNDASFDGAVNTATGLLNMIGNVPKALAKLFSFLPDWCLNLLTLAFVVIVILIVYKLARG